MKRLRLISIAAVALGLAALAAGCGGGGTSGETAGPSTSPDTVLVDVRTGVGGFTPVEIAIENRPAFRLYGDGTVVVRGPEDGALPLPWTYVLSQEGVDAVLEAAATANLLADPPDYGMPPITDVGSTTVALDVPGATVVHDAYALGYEDASADGLSPGQREARKGLTGFVDFVTGLADDRPDLVAVAPGPYEPEAVDVHVWPAPDGAASGGAVEWPLATPPEALPADARLAEARCATARDADLEALLQALGGTEGPVLLRSGDRLWSAGFHVVLPGETACADAAADVLETGYVLPPQAWTNLEPAPGDVFVPATEADAAAAEEAIAGYLASATDPRELEVRDALATSTSQYVGLERDGRRLVYVNAFCDDAGFDPATEVVWVADGGTCFWQATVDTTSGEVLELRINGEA